MGLLDPSPEVAW